MQTTGNILDLFKCVGLCTDQLNGNIFNRYNVFLGYSASTQMYTFCVIVQLGCDISEILITNSRSILRFKKVHLWKLSPSAELQLCYPQVLENVTASVT